MHVGPARCERAKAAPPPQQGMELVRPPITVHSDLSRDPQARHIAVHKASYPLESRRIVRRAQVRWRVRYREIEEEDRRERGEREDTEGRRDTGMGGR